MTTKYIPTDALGVINKMFAKLGEHGWHPLHVFDGEENEKVGSVEEALYVIDSVEYSEVVFCRGASHHTVVLLPGNGRDVICDYSFSSSDDFGDIMDSLQEEEL